MQDKPLILAVDDEPSNLMLISGALKDNYALAMAKSAKLAAQFLEQKKPALILLDILMPEKDGLTFAEELMENQETFSIPIIFLTGAADFDSRRKARALGARAFIEKPISVTELQSVVNGILCVQ